MDMDEQTNSPSGLLLIRFHYITFVSDYLSCWSGCNVVKIASRHHTATAPVLLWLQLCAALVTCTGARRDEVMPDSGRLMGTAEQLCT